MTESPRTPRAASSGAPSAANASERVAPSGDGRAEWERLRRSRFGSADAERDGEAGSAEPGAEWERLRHEGFGGQAGAPSGAPPNLASLLMLLEALRGVVPNELERQFSALLREVLLTLRALIDWYLERLDDPGRERRVEDIPID